MNDVDVPDYGVVFTFGKSRFADNVASHFFIRNDPIIEISCGDQHTAVVCKYGRVFSFGSNEWGQLGLGHRDPVNKPSCVKSLKPEKVKHVTCGRVHSIFTTENGKVYSCGCNTDGQLGIGDIETLDYATLPMFVTEIDEEILQVAAGSQHSVLLTAKGTVYAWGSNLDGQIGLIKSETNTIVHPTLLPISHTLTYISCGSYHTGFISDSKKLFLCGDYGNNQLANNYVEQEQCILVEAGIQGNVISVACGGQYTIALTDDGECYVCGDNSFGQLGIGNLQSATEWIRITFDEVISAISAGVSHSMFLTDSGIVYSCGDSRHGKVCIANDESQNVTKPTKINFPFFTLKVSKIVCGGCHSMIMAHPNSSMNKLSSIRETNKLRKTNTDFLFCENKTDTAPLDSQQKIDPPEEIISFNQRNYFSETQFSSSISLDDNQKMDGVSESNSPNFENTRSLNSDISDKNYFNEEKNDTSDNVNEELNPNFKEKSSEAVLQIEEIPSENKGLKDVKPYTNNDIIAVHEGKFKKFLRHCGIQKLKELKTENNNFRSSYVKDSQEKTEKVTHKSNTNYVSSRVCVLL